MHSPEFLVVVRRGDCDLVNHLREEFAGAELAVIVDRRMVERRLTATAMPVERRQMERRDRSVQWNTLGFVVRRRSGHLAGRPGESSAHA